MTSGIPTKNTPWNYVALNWNYVGCRAGQRLNYRLGLGGPEDSFQPAFVPLGTLRAEDTCRGRGPSRLLCYLSSDSPSESLPAELAGERLSAILMVSVAST